MDLEYVLGSEQSGGEQVLHLFSSVADESDSKCFRADCWIDVFESRGNKADEAGHYTCALKLHAPCDLHLSLVTVGVCQEKWKTFALLQALHKASQAQGARGHFI